MEIRVLGSLLEAPSHAEPKPHPQQLVETDAAVGEFANVNGIQEALLKVGELCVCLLPAVERVQVTLHRDSEDDSVGPHFKVLTKATVQQILEAEDALHIALFRDVDVAALSALSIGYEFVG